ncbi:hypothetical protein PG991_011842 [Apiospora marii]|uniref:Uncharacterized protein n=1 Tax=Apiospora marii TaxID=335849 RepID=A0ABR1RFE9_9PEZI
MGKSLYSNVGVAGRGQLQHLRREVGRSDAGGRYQRVEQRLSLRRIQLVYDPVDHLEDEPITRILLMKSELQIQGVMVALEAVVAVAHESRVLQHAERLRVEEAKAYQMQLLVGHDRRQRSLQAFDHGIDGPVGPLMEVEICDLTDPESAVPDDQLQHVAQLTEVISIERQGLEQLDVGRDLGQPLLGDGGVQPVQNLLEGLVVGHLGDYPE